MNYHQNPLDNNAYIELPTEITNFQDLINQNNFSAIQQQYKNYILQLAELYYHFTGLKCDEQINISIEHIAEYSNNSSDNLALFYSYKTIRKYIYIIINYLSYCKNNNKSNNHIATICAKLTDCFGFCLPGFNSKIANINDYIINYSNINLADKISIKIKNVLKSCIEELLIEIKNLNILKIQANMHIHYHNAIFNLVAHNFNFASAIDKHANLNKFNQSTLETITNRINISLSKYNICKLISEEFYIILENVLTKAGKIYWLNNYIADFTNEYNEYLEDYFFNIVNEFFKIQNIDSKLKISDIIKENEYSNNLYFANIKDTLHIFIAHNIDKLPYLFTKSSTKHDLVAYINSDLAIHSINNGYFYVKTNKELQIPLQLKHLINITLTEIDINDYLPIFIQALHQTFSLQEIYNFFSATISNKMLFNPFILIELKNCINNYTNIKNIILLAITEPEIKQGYIKNITIYHELIKNNILSVEIITKLLNNKLDISNLLDSFNLTVVYRLLTLLDCQKINEIFTQQTTETNFLYKTSYAFYAFVKHKKWNIITKLLSSKFKFYLIKYLSYNQKNILFVLLLNEKKYNIINHFLLDYVTYNIVDKNNNNILHHAINNNDIQLLYAITNNKYKTILHLLCTENSDGLYPIMLAYKKNKNCFSLLLKKSNSDALNMQDSIGNTILIQAIYKRDNENIKLLIAKCNANILEIKNHYNYNALMIASKIGYLFYIKNLLIKFNKNVLTACTINGSNSLMLAIANKHDDCFKFLLPTYLHENLLATQDIFGNNALHLAIKHKINYIEKLITELTIPIINAQNGMRFTCLMMACEYKESNNVIDELIKKQDHNMINIKDNDNNNSVMIAAKYGHLYCLENLIQQITYDDLTTCNKDKNNCLMLAIQHGHTDCANFLIQTSNIDIIKQKNNFGLNALMIACMNGNLECIKNLLKKTDLTILIECDATHFDCLTLALRHNNYHCVEYLLEICSNDILKILFSRLKLHEKTSLAFNILMIACKKGLKIAIIEILLNNFDNKILTMKNKKGNNALMLACKNGNLECIKLLLLRGDNNTLTDCNKKGFDSLMLSAQYGHDNCTKYLLQNCNPNIFKKSLAKPEFYV